MHFELGMREKAVTVLNTYRFFICEISGPIILQKLTEIDGCEGV